jgi:hypothetical protein
MTLPTRIRLNDAVLNAYMADVSAASSCFVTSPTRGKIMAIYGELYNAITSADSNITVKINGVLVTGATAVIAYTSSAAGDTYTMNPTGAFDVNAGDTIEIISDGASSTTAPMNWTVVVRAY